jgi:hypothetical protein
VIAGVADTAAGVAVPTLWRNGTATDLTTRGRSAADRIVDLNTAGEMVANRGDVAVLIRPVA